MGHAAKHKHALLCIGVACFCLWGTVVPAAAQFMGAGWELNDGGTAFPAALRLHLETDAASRARVERLLVTLPDADAAGVPGQDAWGVQRRYLWPDTTAVAQQTASFTLAWSSPLYNTNATAEAQWAAYHGDLRRCLLVAALYAQQTEGQAPAPPPGDRVLLERSPGACGGATTASWFPAPEMTRCSVLRAPRIPPLYPITLQRVWEELQARRARRPLYCGGTAGLRVHQDCYSEGTDAAWGPELFLALTLEPGLPDTPSGKRRQARGALAAPERLGHPEDPRALQNVTFTCLPRDWRETGTFLSAEADRRRARWAAAWGFTASSYWFPHLRSGGSLFRGLFSQGAETDYVLDSVWQWYQSPALAAAPSLPFQTLMDTPLFVGADWRAYPPSSTAGLMPYRCACRPGWAGPRCSTRDQGPFVGTLVQRLVQSYGAPAPLLAPSVRVAVPKEACAPAVRWVQQSWDATALLAAFVAAEAAEQERATQRRLQEAKKNCEARSAQHAYVDNTCFSPAEVPGSSGQTNPVNWPPDCYEVRAAAWSTNRAGALFVQRPVCSGHGTCFRYGLAQARPACLCVEGWHGIACALPATDRAQQQVPVPPPLPSARATDTRAVCAPGPAWVPTLQPMTREAARICAALHGTVYSDTDTDIDRLVCSVPGCAPPWPQQVPSFIRRDQQVLQWVGLVPCEEQTWERLFRLAARSSGSASSHSAAWYEDEGQLLQMLRASTACRLPQAVASNASTALETWMLRRRQQGASVPDAQASTRARSSPELVLLDDRQRPGATGSQFVGAYRLTVVRAAYDGARGPPRECRLGQLRFCVALCLEPFCA